MRSIFRISIRLVFALLFAITPLAAHGQDAAKLHFEKLNGLEAKALDVVEVNVDGKVLDVAKRVLAKSKDPDAQKVGQAISGLQAIYVRAYTFENANEYNLGDMDEIREQLKGSGWEKLANVRSKKNNQKVDVYTMFTGDVMSGVAVVMSEDKTIAVVNVIGPIDIDMLAELGGRLDIPRMDIEVTGKKDKPKN